MELLNKSKLIKLKKKNLCNTRLIKEVDKLIKEIEGINWKTKNDIKEYRKDADCVHNEGFYFFNIHIHRTMILIEFEDNLATVIWVGSHDEYDTTFKGNKDTIENWLRNQGLIN